MWLIMWDTFFYSGDIRSINLESQSCAMNNPQNHYIFMDGLNHLQMVGICLSVYGTSEQRQGSVHYWFRLKNGESRREPLDLCQVWTEHVRISNFSGTTQALATCGY